jgi:cation transport ATPase
VQETPGEGVTGRIGTIRVAVGTPAFVALQTGAGWGAPPPDPAPGDAVVALALDGRPAGRLVLSDPLREDAAGLLAGLRAAGVRRIVLATGDAPEVAQHAVAGLGLDRIAAGLDPAAKVAVVRAEAAQGPVMMVGDGVNDAPALAAARVGVAMGVRGAAASAEAADVVLLVDRLGPLHSGLAIARGARAIAVQSVVAGIGLSTLGMLAAAVGWLTPVQGAILQEAIDVAVILNALRVLALPVGTPRVLPASIAEPAPGARP